MIKYSFKNIFAVLMAAVTLLCSITASGAGVSAEGGERIVVGASADYGIGINNGELSGIAFDYLKAISHYTNHRYSYLDATRDELFQMLADGKIDVIPCVTANEYEQFMESYQPATVYAISETSPMPTLSANSLTKKFTAVYTYDKNEYAPTYYDMDSIKKSTIGYLSENENMYFINGKIKHGELEGAKFVEYTTEQQMQDDFYSGKISAVIKESFRCWENESIIYQADTADCYFLVSASNPLLATQLGNAMNTLHMSSSGFSTDLYNKHIGKYGMPKYGYSLAEKEYIKSNPDITIAYNISACVPASYNSGTKELKGFVQSFVNEVNSHSGLNIKIKVCSSLQECIQLLDSGEVQAVFGGVNSSSISSYGNYRVSNAFLTIPIVFSGIKDKEIKKFSKVAVCSNDKDIIGFMERCYSDVMLIPCDNVKESIQAVRDGRADVVCTGSYEAYTAISSGSSDFEIIQVTTDYHNECFAYRLNEEINLGMIIGKNITRMECYNDVMGSISGVGITITEISDNNSLSHEAASVIIFASAAIVIGVILFTLIMRHKNKKVNEIDPLTGGRSKQKFFDDAKKLLKKSHAEKLTIVLFDINKFKYVNDRLGYEEGDRMLMRLHKTIADNLDADEIHARLSDDNFVMIIKNAQDSEIANRMNTIFTEFERRNNLFVKYNIIFTAGVCRLGQCRDYDGSKEIDLNIAIDRCKIAKRTLKNRHTSAVAFYDGKIREKALREKDYENIMPTALKQHEFECYLQPKYGLKSRRIEGAEALIRWNSKDFGFIFPDEFIPLSEKNGFVVELDFYILEEVCKCMRRWLNEGKTPVVISVNQSRLHLNYDDYIWRLREIVDKYEIPYEYVELELTESVFEENSEKLLTIMQKLHDIGFKLSLDDFGSGYSSLNMLKDIPVDVVKIDREFFNGTVNSEKGRAVITTVCDLASNLNMEVISEGVETLEQVEFLTEINCAMVQGYYFARPMTIPAFEELWFKELEEQQEQ